MYTGEIGNFIFWPVVHNNGASFQSKDV